MTTKWGTKTLGLFTAQYDTTRGWRTGQDSGSSGGTHADSWTKLLNLGDGINAATASYDGYGRLLGTGAPAWQNVAGSVSLPTRNLSWTYDLAGNRKTESEAGGAPTTYSTTGSNPNADGRLNQYESITGTRAEPGIAYDADGNLTQDSVWTYSYDAENRLKTLTKSGQSITMDYDYMGRRIRKTVTDTGAYDIKFLWTGWKLAAELASDGETVNKVFVWGRDFSDVQGNAGGAGSLLAQIAGTTISYAVPDAFGTIVGYITSANGGKLVAAVEYSPYGKGVNAAGNWQDYPIGFSGQYMDWEPGLVYYGRRHYAPKHGRFINRDPIEEQGGNNLYGFVNNSPYRGWDVLGLCTFVGSTLNCSRVNVGGFKSTGEELGYLFSSGFLSHTLDNWFGKWQPMLTYGNTITPVAPISPALKAALDRRARAPNSLAAADVGPGGGKPVFNSGDVAGVLNGTSAGQALLGRLKSGEFVVKTGDVYLTVLKDGKIVGARDAAGNLVPAVNLIGGYLKGSHDPALIVINNLASSSGTFKGTDAQFYAYVLVQEVNEYDIWRAGTPGNDKAVEVINRVNAENQARAMGLPEAQSGYRTATGAPNVDAIRRDVDSNPAYNGPTHGGSYIIRNGVVVPWP